MHCAPLRLLQPLAAQTVPLKGRDTEAGQSPQQPKSHQQQQQSTVAAATTAQQHWLICPLTLFDDNGIPLLQWQRRQ